MQQRTFQSLVLTGLAAVSMASGLKAETMEPTPVPGTVVVTPVPKPNPNAATGMVEKQQNAIIKAALQPLRDKLAADRVTLNDAIASGDQTKIDAAKAAIKADLTAIRDKRVAMEHDRRALGQAAKEGRDKSGDRDDKKEGRSMKGGEHRDKPEGMKNKALEHR